MKVTKSLSQFIKAEVKHYAYLLKIKRIPDIALNMIQMEKDSTNPKQWGHYFHADKVRGRMIFLNIEKHTTKIELRWTIVHELVHVKYPKLKHGDKFDKIVDRYFMH